MEYALLDSSGRPASVELEVRTERGPQPLTPCPWQFPDPRAFPGDGCVGEGADFAPATIVAAYRRGIFPWPHPRDEYLWFSPDPRAILPVGGLHVSARLGRTVRQGRYRATVDGAFERVMRSCAKKREDGTWITEALIDGYTRLHGAGWAHSIEVWDAAGELAGGLYGVAAGAMFGAESMFHRQRDASKVAMVALMQHAAAIGVRLVDVQVLTPHTERMGAIEIPRGRYLDLLGDALRHEAGWFKPGG